MRGRTTSPHPGRAPSPGPPLPPSYARSQSQSSPPPSRPTTAASSSTTVSPQAPQTNPHTPPTVPPPIYLRSSSPSSLSTKGALKLHIPAWGIIILRPPLPLELHPLDSGIDGQQPPCEDKVLTGALEVIMKERRRVVGISVGVVSVCKLYMGVKRGWEEDGVFERGVEVLGGDSEGIWLEKGSQSFSFTILLPATLATHDHHQFGRISYMLTAKVEGIPSKPLTSFFKTSSSPTSQDDSIPYKEDFDNVIARSTELVQDLSLQRSGSRGSVGSNRSGGVSMSRGGSWTGLGGRTPPLSPPDPTDPSSSYSAESSPTLMGLYHRRQSNESLQRPSLLSLGSSPLANLNDRDDNTDAGSIRSFGTAGGGNDYPRSEKNGWLKGDLVASRGLIVHANPTVGGGVYELNIRKEGFVDGLGGWRFMVSADVFTISSVILLSFNIPKPSPQTTIFFTRLLLTQTYKITSPRTPDKPPFQPEAAKHHVLYQIGRPHKSGEKVLGWQIPSLWRGAMAGGTGACGGLGGGGVGGGGEGEDEGWRIRAVARLPAHEKIRPSTNAGTITPIRVTHDLQLQVFYSVEGETVGGKPMDGPGELRMMMVKIPVTVPSCCCTRDSLNLPSYQTTSSTPQNGIDQFLLSPPTKPTCACGHTFAELGEAQMRRMQIGEAEDHSAGGGAGAGAGAPSGGEGGSGSGSSGSALPTGGGGGGDEENDRGRQREEERQWWARREEKDREARSSSRGRYD